ncbi:MAG: Prokaryotic lipoprotein-attachment site [Ramlibacter sp.]|jgi:predicted small lipoprotein YifL|nr:Prokaryotic lipoprotein-attachment site [Ramlibacter sp.]
MSGVFQILVSPRRGPALALAAALLVAGCGQKGALYLPTGEAAAGRASLPQTLAPSTAVRPAQAASGPGAATPPSGTAAPVRNP